MTTTSLPKRLEPFVVPGGLKGQLAELPLPDILQHLRGVARHRHPLPGVGRRAQGPLPQGRPRRLRLQQPAQRPPGRDPDPRGQDHGRGVRGLDPRHLQGQAPGQGAGRDGAPSAPRTSGKASSSRSRRSSTASSSGTRASSTSRSRRCPRRSASPSTSTSGADPGGHPAGRRRRPHPGAAIPRGPGAGAGVAEARRRRLEPYEHHVLRLVDGERSVLEICRESEIGDNETLKVLYALLCDRPPAGQGQEGARPRPGLRARGHPLLRARLLQPDVRLHLQVHGARGGADRGERAREVPGRPARERARTCSRG